MLDITLHPFMFAFGAPLPVMPAAPKTTSAFGHLGPGCEALLAKSPRASLLNGVAIPSVAGSACSTSRHSADNAAIGKQRAPFVRTPNAERRTMNIRPPVPPTQLGQPTFFH